MPSPLDYFCVQSTNASLFTSHPREASELFATMACDGALKLWDLRICRWGYQGSRMCSQTERHLQQEVCRGALFNACVWNL